MQKKFRLEKWPWGAENMEGPECGSREARRSSSKRRSIPGPHNIVRGRYSPDGRRTFLLLKIKPKISINN